MLILYSLGNLVITFAGCQWLYLHCRYPQTSIRMSRDLQILIWICNFLRVYWSVSPPPVWDIRKPIETCVVIFDMFSGCLLWTAVIIWRENPFGLRALLSYLVAYPKSFFTKAVSRTGSKETQAAAGKKDDSWASTGGYQAPYENDNMAMPPHPSNTMCGSPCMTPNGTSDDAASKKASLPSDGLIFGLVSKIKKAMFTGNPGYGNHKKARDGSSSYDIFEQGSEQQISKIYDNIDDIDERMGSENVPFYFNWAFLLTATTLIGFVMVEVTPGGDNDKKWERAAVAFPFAKEIAMTNMLLDCISVIPQLYLVFKMSDLDAQVLHNSGDTFITRNPLFEAGTQIMHQCLGLMCVGRLIRSCFWLIIVAEDWYYLNWGLHYLLLYMIPDLVYCYFMKDYMFAWIGKALRNPTKTRFDPYADNRQMNNML